MWLPWETAFQITVPLGVLVIAATWAQRHPHARWIDVTRAFLLELTFMFVLYGVWQYVHEQAITKTVGAVEHARAVYRFEQRIHLPSELTLQNAFLHHRAAMQFLNIFYAGAHVPAVGVLLVWLYVRHRDRYARVRTTLALTIAGCLALQMIPVAPPRLLPDLGFVDTALLYGQSVYGTGGSGISNQLAAMPSLHVGWAVLVGIAAVTIGTGRWRWLVLLHPLLTIVAVTATSNHWWLDGVVAVMVMGVGYAIVRAAAFVRSRVVLSTPRPAVAHDGDGDGDDGDAEPEPRDLAPTATA